MRVVVTLEHRFDRTPDGSVWTQTMFARPFWERYLEGFDDVRVVARVRDVPSVPGDWLRADGGRVSFWPVPYYVGPWQFLRRARRVKAAVRAAVGPADAVILRVGSQLASCLQPSLVRAGHPYGVEVVGDPYDVHAPGGVRHPLRPYFRYLFPRQLRRQCAGATAAAYVTSGALQRRYPPSETAFATYFSDVELPPAAFATSPRPAHSFSAPFTLITVGTLAQLYKAQDILIDAVAECVRSGLDLRLLLVGDGQFRPMLAAQAARLGISDRVQFLGQVSAGAAVRERLDAADLFVLPSRQEGLPRALVEAMARGLPCVGSTVGGIPELLPAEDLVPPGDARSLSQKLGEVLADPQRLARMSARNMERAGEYREEALRGRRLEYFRQLRDRTEAWTRDGTAPGPGGRRPLLVHVMTVPQSLFFLRGQVGYLRTKGFTIHAVASPGEDLERFGQEQGVPVHAVTMGRRITPLRDCVAVFRLWRLFRRLRPDIVHGATPKGGLLGMVAAWLARVPVRVYHIHGLPFVTAKGFRRRLLTRTEVVSCRLAHQVLCVSRSVREVALDEGLCPPDKIATPAAGSVNGVDAEGTFDPGRVSGNARSAIHARYGIPPGAVVAGFVGRIVRDKGLVELAGAWKVVRDVFPELHLLVVGPFEPQDPVPPEVVAWLRTDPRVHLVGPTRDMPAFYAAMDFVVLPTYREGFNTVILETAAMGLPVIASRVPGCVDGVVEGETGTLVPPRDSAALAAAMRAYLGDATLRLRHGHAAREHVVRSFRPADVWEAVHQIYRRQLVRAGNPLPLPSDPAAVPLRGEVLST